MFKQQKGQLDKIWKIILFWKQQEIYTETPFKTEMDNKGLHDYVTFIGILHYAI